MGSRGVSAVIGLLMLALGSSEAPAQVASAFDIKATVKALDVGGAAQQIGTRNATTFAPRSIVSISFKLPTATSAFTPAIAIAVSASRVVAPIAVPVAMASLPVAAPLSGVVPAGWTPTSMAALSSMLSSVVSSSSANAPLDAELTCLATAVYFESRGEPLEGQLAVANVVINRAASGRYPASMCAVVKQKAQFSFVRNGEFPAVDANSAAWIRAEAVARIAAAKVLTALPQNVLWYHATYVAPTWRRNLVQVEQIGMHVFYRS